eukprot:scaffold221983_cov25-Tisochrysis_lutea.AAC.3
MLELVPFSNSSAMPTGMILRPWSGWPIAISTTGSMTRYRGCMQMCCIHANGSSASIHARACVRVRACACVCTHQTSNANTNNSTRSATCKMQALNLYKDLMQFEDFDSMVHIYAAACYYYMGLYKEAEEEAEQVPPF